MNKLKITVNKGVGMLLNGFYGSLEKKSRLNSVLTAGRKNRWFKIPIKGVNLQIRDRVEFQNNRTKSSLGSHVTAFKRSSVKAHCEMSYKNLCIKAHKNVSQ